MHMYKTRTAFVEKENQGEKGVCEKNWEVGTDIDTLLTLV